MYDIAIIGAGCVGNYLALNLAELGFKVLVIERKAEAGLNICCTGIISKDCCELLSLKVNLKVSALNTAIITTPGWQTININTKENIAYIIERIEFEKSLSVRAQSSGALFVYSTTVRNIFTEKDKVVLNTFSKHGNKQFDSKLVVICTGYGSKLPYSLGLGKIDKYVIGTQAEVDITSNETLEIYLDKKLSPAGFAWLVRTWNDKGLAGLLCRSMPQKHMKAFLGFLKERNKIADRDYIINHALIPVKPLNKSFTDRIIVVGEAAGQVKPLTGGGIYYGIICANIAIETIVEAFRLNDFSRHQLAAYQNKWHKLLKNEVITAYHLRNIWEKLNNQPINIILNIAQKLNIIAEIGNSKNIYFDWHIKTLSNLLTSFIPFAKRK
jgi:digeranylgeranylglycerophospholipid reductase